MKKILMIVLTLAVASFSCEYASATMLFAKGKRLVVSPDNAKIYIDGNYVGDGSFEVRFGGKDDFFMVRVEAPGYVEKKMRIFKHDKRNVIAIDLRKDDTIENSVASNLANQYFTINVRPDVDEDLAWKLLSQVMLNYFNELKTSDKASGYMNTNWVVETFAESEQKVRTMVQIKQVTGGDGLSYQIRISSEIAPLDAVGQQGFKPWNRVLKRFEPLVNEMQSRIGDN
ncbi:MAG: PEGA domain-containing protein [Alistipes sp.]|nr:PEGA domain-containing protein [Alistipes sp.]